MTKIVIQKKIKNFNKIIGVDSDKSLSIRSLLIGSQSYGKCTIKNLSKSGDVISAIEGLKNLGVKIKFIDNKTSANTLNLSGNISFMIDDSHSISQKRKFLLTSYNELINKIDKRLEY